MATKSLNYQYFAKRFVTAPFVAVLLVCFSVYLVMNMVSTIQHEVAHVKNLNQLLAQTASTKDQKLIANQAKYLSNTSEYIESIKFFPTATSDNVPAKELSLTDMFFGKYYGINEPVVLHSDYLIDNDTTKIEHFIGYINTTLSLQKIRYQWFYHNLPMFATILIASLLTLLIMLKTLKTATSRLPLLEMLSKKVLENEEFDKNDFQNSNNNQAVWLYEQALFHLLSKQKTQQHYLENLTREIATIKSENEKQTEQYTNFQSGLTHELKLSLNQIEAGLKLLESLYISNEQQNAVEMIDFGIDDLNTKLNQLVQINRLEKGQMAIEYLQFNPAHVINNIVEKCQKQAREKELLLTAKPYHSDYVLEGDLQKIIIILTSLVDNAIKFTEKGSVTISSQIQHLEQNIRWTIQVTDTGIGIEQQYLNQIFQPFFQINPNSKYKANPHAFGLFLIKKLVKLIDGEIEVESQFGKGTTFSIHLLLKDWNSHITQVALRDKKIAIFYKNEAVITHAQRLINAGAEVYSFTDKGVLLDYIDNHDIDLLIITFKIPQNEVLAITKHIREKENNQNFRRLILHYYQPKYLSPVQAERLKTAGVDYLEDATIPTLNWDKQLKQIIKYIN